MQIKEGEKECVGTSADDCRFHVSIQLSFTPRHCVPTTSGRKVCIGVSLCGGWKSWFYLLVIMFK